MLLTLPLLVRIIDFSKEMCEFFHERKGKVHALVVYNCGVPAPHSYPPFPDGKAGPHPNEGRRLVCVRCGLSIEPRRWKQFRGRNCRHSPATQDYRTPQEADSEEGWTQVRQTHDFLQGVLGDDANPSAKQRRILADVCEVSRACLEKIRARSLVQGIGAGGRRSLRIATLNVGTLRGRSSGLFEVGDAVFVQESMITPQMTSSIKGDAATAGLAFFQGVCARNVRDALGRMAPAKAEGLGLVCATNLAWFGIKKGLPDGCSLHRRVHSGWLALEDLTLVIHNLYLRTGDSEAVIQENSEIMSEVVRRVQGIDHKHQVILGDFQNMPSDLMEFAGLFRAGWFSSCSSGQTAGIPTNFPSEGQARVLDALLVSPSLAARWESFSVHDIWGYSTHKAVVGSFSIEPMEEECWKLAPPKSLPDGFRGRDNDWWTERLERRHRDDCEQTWTSFCEVMSQWLDEEGVRQRGTVGSPHFYRAPVEQERRSGRQRHEPTQWRRHVLTKMCRHLKEMRGLQKANLTEVRGRRVTELASCRMRMPWTQMGLDVPEMPMTEGSLELLESQVRSLRDDCVHKLETRLLRWKQRMYNSLESCPRDPCGLAARAVCL